MLPGSASAASGASAPESAAVEQPAWASAARRAAVAAAEASVADGQRAVAGASVPCALWSVCVTCGCAAARAASRQQRRTLPRAGGAGVPAGAHSGAARTSMATRSDTGPEAESTVKANS
jgi:hypothetical protein